MSTHSGVFSVRSSWRLILTAILYFSCVNLSATTVAPNGAESTIAASKNTLSLATYLKEQLSDSPHPIDQYDAQVWTASVLNKISPFKIESSEAAEILTNAYRYALAADIPPELVLAIIETESSFNRFAVSKVGAQGLMQVMPFWKETSGSISDNLFNIETNIAYGVRIYAYYLKSSQQKHRIALAKYNGSFKLSDSKRFIYADKVLERWQFNWRTAQINNQTIDY